MFSNMKAVALIRRRIVLAEDAFAEVVVWKMDAPVSPSPHPFKYRLAYIVAGECVLRYDNERGNGDHRHTAASETSYPFSTVDQLLVDFGADLERWNHEHSRS